jgi:hypothetical protein
MQRILRLWSILGVAAANGDQAPFWAGAASLQPIVARVNTNVEEILRREDRD